MKIAIDAARAINEKAGVGKYTKFLIRNLQKEIQNEELLLLFNFWRDFDFKRNQALAFRDNRTAIKVTKFPGPYKDKLLKSKIGFSKHLIQDADAFLAPTFLDVDISLKIPQIVVIHDLSMFYYPEFFEDNLGKEFQKLTKIACEKSTHIIAVSESTKKDLVKFLSINPKKITVIYPGLNKFEKIAAKMPEGLKEKSYILNVGTIEPRKNLVNLLLAYDMLPKELQEKYPLVITGASGWRNSNIFKIVENLNSKNHIHFLGYLEDDDLAKLYKEAKVMIYPSFYEGFGLPIIEAMQFGTPVITSNLSSMPEAADKAGLLINPNNKESIKDALEKILLEKVDVKALSENGLLQSEKFDWSAAARKTLELIKELI